MWRSIGLEWTPDGSLDDLALLYHEDYNPEKKINVLQVGPDKLEIEGLVYRKFADENPSYKVFRDL